MSHVQSPSSSSQKSANIHIQQNKESTQSHKPQSQEQHPTSYSFLDRLASKFSSLFHQSSTILPNGIPSILSELPTEYSFALLKREYNRLRFKLERDETEEKRLIIVVWCMYVIRDYLLEQQSGEHAMMNLATAAQRGSEEPSSQRETNPTLWYLLNSAKLAHYEKMIEKDEKEQEKIQNKEGDDSKHVHHHQQQLDGIIESCLTYRSLTDQSEVLESFDSFRDCIHKLSGGAWKDASDLELDEDKRLKGAHGQVGRLRVNNIAVETLVGRRLSHQVHNIGTAGDLYEDGVDLEENGHVDKEHYIPREEQIPCVKNATEESVSSDEEVDELTNRSMSSESGKSSGRSSLSRSHEMCFHEE